MGSLPPPPFNQSLCPLIAPNSTLFNFTLPFGLNISQLLHALQACNVTSPLFDPMLSTTLNVSGLVVTAIYGVALYVFNVLAGHPNTNGPFGAFVAAAAASADGGSASANLFALGSNGSSPGPRSDSTVDLQVVVGFILMVVPLLAVATVMFYRVSARDPKPAAKENKRKRQPRPLNG